MAVILYHTCPLSDETDAEIGGANIYVLELSKELAKKGYKLDIFTRSQDPKSPRLVQVFPNLRVIHTPAGPESPLSKKDIVQYIPEFLNNFYTFMQEQKTDYDIVSCHYYLSGLIGMDIQKTLKIPLIMTFHTLGLMKNLVARNDDERESIERIKAELLLVEKADKVIATSETDAQYIETLYNGDSNKIVILTPGVDLDLFKPMEKSLAKKLIGADPDHKILLFVGRIEPLKGIDVLLYAMKILMEKNPALRVCVWIVGGDISQAADNWSRELQKLSEIRRVLKISMSVKFVGRKEQRALPAYYNAAEVLVAPSQYESFGITAVESMACGVPVITTDVTGVSNLFDKEHPYLITSANNPILLAEKIKSLLDDEQEYNRVSQEVYSNARDLSWANAANQFVGLCKSCSNKYPFSFK